MNMYYIVKKKQTPYHLIDEVSKQKVLNYLSVDEPFF
jgi:hypothetical protein